VDAGLYFMSDMKIKLCFMNTTIFKANFKSIVGLVAITLLGVCGCSGISMMIKSSTEIKEVPSFYGIPYEEMWIDTDEGGKLHAYFVSGWPERPLVVFFHGNAGNISNRVSNLCYLRTIGVPIVIFDYRGYGLTEGTPTDENSLYGDGRAVVQYMKSRGWELDNMVYFGRSMGGAIALEMAIVDPPAGLVLEGAWTSMKQESRHFMPFFYYTVGWWAFPDIFNNVEKIGSLKVPLVLIHGSEDKIVPTWMSEKLYEEAPDPKSLHIIEGAGHSDSHLVGDSDYWNVWLDFLNANGFEADILPENMVCEDGPVK
jgi:pimeloyl-ACP methyl ester carboxylesterase